MVFARTFTLFVKSNFGFPGAAWFSAPMYLKDKTKPACLQSFIVVGVTAPKMAFGPAPDFGRNPHFSV